MSEARAHIESHESASAFHGVARALAAARHVGEVLPKVAEGALELTGAIGAYVERAFDHRDVEIVATAGRGTPEIGTRVPYPGSLTEAIIDARHPELLTEIGAIGESMAPYLDEGCARCSGLVVPLLFEAQVLGAMVLLRDAGHPHFNEADVNRARNLGDLASIALRRVYLEEANERERREKSAFLDSSGEGIYGLDADGRCTFLNRAGSEMLGYDRDEVLRQNMHRLIHHSREDGSPYPAEDCPIYRTYRRGDQVRGATEVLWRKDGTAFPVEFSSAPIREDGRITGAVVTFHDVSERLRVEASVRESEQRFRSLADNASDAIITIDQNDIILYANPATERLFGYDRDELLSMPFTKLMPERHRRQHREGIRRYIETGDRNISWDGIELPGLHRDGTEIPLEITFGEFVRDERHFFTGIMRDITERKRAEEERARLLESERQARQEAERTAREEAALREAAQAVTATFTVDEVIRQIAQNAVKAVGADGAFVERAEADREEVEVVAVAGSRNPPVGTQIPYADSFAESVLRDHEPRIIRDLSRTDRPLPRTLAQACDRCSAVVIPLIDAGDAIGALILLRGPDRTPFYDDEIARAHTFGDLAALAFRKVHLLEDSERKREELLRVMESRARLVRGFSHDVKNPLGAATGYLDLLAEGMMGEIDAEQRSSIDRVRASIRSALDLIDDLVDLARAEAGQLDVEYASTDVRGAVHEIGEEYRARAEAAQLSMSVDLSEELPIIQSDPDRIRQILGNLLSNAVKYTPEGGRITLRAETREETVRSRSGRWIAIDVSDTGPGIPEDKQHLLFEEFSRIDPEAEKRGAGLGLAISKRIADVLNGDITVESEVDRGSTFTLWLPTTRPPTESDEAVDVGPPDGSTNGRTGE